MRAEHFGSDAFFLRHQGAQPLAEGQR
jgi:hypothetical protein